MKYEDFDSTVLGETAKTIQKLANEEFPDIGEYTGLLVKCCEIDSKIKEFESQVLMLNNELQKVPANNHLADYYHSEMRGLEIQKTELLSERNELEASASVLAKEAVTAERDRMLIFNEAAEKIRLRLFYPRPHPEN